jgi:hypothetical protein
MNVSKLLYQLSGLTIFGRVTSLCQKRAEEVLGRSCISAVAVDISWLCHQLRISAVTETSKVVTEFMRRFVREGFMFYATVDTDFRYHDTQKASSRQEFERQRSVAAKTKIMAISRDWRKTNYNNKQQDAILRENLKTQEAREKKVENAIGDIQDHPKSMENVQRALEQLEQQYPK